jgi:hypothetical protein
MPSDLLLSLTDAVLSYAIDKLNPAETIKAWLKREPARLAFQKALARTYVAFARQYPEYVKDLFNKSFLEKESAPELARFLVRGPHPDPATLALAWGKSLGQEPHSEFCQRATKPAGDFLAWLEAELKAEPVFQPLFDSRALDSLPRLETQIEKLTADMTPSLETALKQVSESSKIALIIGGNVQGSNIVIGNNNVVNMGGDSERLPRIFQVPPLPKYFIPRPKAKDALLNQVLRTSTTTGALIVSAVQGLGGIGKTTLVADLARHPKMRERYPDGVLWATLGQTPELLSILHAWIRALGDYKYGPLTTEDATNHLRTLLVEKACLLVVDDAWNADHVQPFLVGNDRCQILITTRDANLSRKVKAQLYDLDVMSEAQALALFEARLGALGEHRQIAADLAKELGYLPLALELAAAQIEGGQTWQKLLAAFCKGLADLDALSLDEATHRNESLRLSFKLSLEQLTQDEQDSFAWLGVLPDDAQLNPQMAATLWDVFTEDAGKRLQRFRNKALLKTVGEERYAVHDLLHDEAKLRLAEKIPIPQAHTKLLDRYNILCEPIRTDPNTPPAVSCLTRPWHTLPNDNYIHAHLSWHMHQAGQPEAIHALLNEETQAGQNGWYATCDSLGQTTIFLADLRQAWQLANAALADPIQRAVALPQQVLYALCLASLTSLSANYPPALLSLAIHERQVTFAQALSLVKQMPDERQQADSLKAIAALLPESCLVEALTIAECLPEFIPHYFENPRAEAIEGLAPYLPKMLMLRALAIIADGKLQMLQVHRVKAMTTLAERLTILAATELIEPALGIIETLEDEQEIAKILSKLAPLLPLPYLARVLNITQEIKESDWASGMSNPRAAILRALAPHLPTPLLAQAMQITSTISDERKRSEILQQLFRNLPAILSAPALDIVRTITDAWPQATALQHLAPHLQPLLQVEALEVARAIPEPSPRFYTLIAFVPLLAEPFRTETLTAAIEMIGMFKNPWDGEDAFKSLAALPLPQSLFSHAMSAARNGVDIQMRVRSLSALALCLPEVQKRQVLSEALQASSEVPDPVLGAQLLGQLIPQLPEPLLDEAFRVAQSLPDDFLRARVLNDLIPLLAEPLADQARQAAVATIKGITSQRWRVFTLAQLTPYISETYWLQAVEEVLALKTNEIASMGFTRPEILVGLANYLPEPHKTKALTDALKEAGSTYYTVFDQNIKTLPELAAHLPEPLKSQAWEQVLDRTRSIKSLNARANFLDRIFSILPESYQTQVLIETLNAVKAIGDGDDRAYLLSYLVGLLRQPEQATEFLRTIRNETTRAAALHIIAPYVSETHFSLLWDTAKAMDDPLSCAQALIDLLSFGPRLELDTTLMVTEALEITHKIQDIKQQVFTLCDLLPHLSKDLKAEILSEILVIIRSAEAYDLFVARDWDDRVLILEFIAPHLPTALLDQACDATRTIPINRLQAESLGCLAPYLPEPHKSKVLADAVAIINQIRDGAERARVLGKLAPHLTERQKTKILSKVLDMLRSHKTGNGFDQVHALQDLAPYLTGPQMEKALALARGIRWNIPRAKALAVLAPYVAPSPRQKQVLNEALTIARSAGDKETLAKILIALAVHLPESEKTQAYTDALEAMKSTTEGSALTNIPPATSLLRDLVPNLPQALIAQALNLAITIRDTDYREQPRAYTLAVIAPVLCGWAQAQPEAAVSAWGMALPELALHQRRNLLGDLQALAPFWVSLVPPDQQPSVVTAVSQAIQAICRWWP